MLPNLVMSAIHSGNRIWHKVKVMRTVFFLFDPPKCVSLFIFLSFGCFYPIQLMSFFTFDTPEL